MRHIIHRGWKLVAAASAALLLVACASSPPKPVVDYKADYDFSQVKKIAYWKKSGGTSGENPVLLSDIQRGRIDEGLTQTLVAKGFEVITDPRQADMLISWHLATQDKTDVRTYETPSYGASYGAGYGRYGRYNRYSMYNCWNCTQTQVSVQNYTQGTFIVDMIDPGLKKSVWRSVTQSKLKGEGALDQQTINSAANRIMADFPPGAATAQ